MTRILLATAALAALTAGAATAQGRDRGPHMGRGMPPMMGPMMDMERLDADGDGAVTAAEIDQAMATRFAAADTNGDGALSAEEMAAEAERMRQEALLRQMQRLIGHMDADDDGLLQLAEIEARAPSSEALLDRLDRDDDGSLSAEELEPPRGPRGWGRGGPWGHRGGPGGEGRHGPRGGPAAEEARPGADAPQDE
ncbi:calcium-binding protein [Pseudoroseicyclus aestuarii]|uniref:EF hand domain-containing protein n=1 Tax=Pseudoroseicyclus aestuarii TaxID=1795041 RepID=A0A318SWN6_9RHOB|nr:calcium-binding protein [Pseudoroseicyclus aestuarii]PYE85883.1 EF hand domain-containing protein [Pseudoroseicyclus aestuarii]